MAAHRDAAAPLIPASSQPHIHNRLSRHHIPTLRSIPLAFLPSSPPITTPPPTSLSAVYESTGSLASVVRLLPLHLSLPPPPSHVLVRFLAAPINPSDLNTVEGVYPHQPPTLPATPGHEGVAEVALLPPSSSSPSPPSPPALRVGDWVTMRQPCMGTWREWAVLPTASLDLCPPHLTVPQAATLSVNPCTALRLLSDFLPSPSPHSPHSPHSPPSLPPGSTIIQNGSTSAVGQCVIQMARLMGWQTVDLVRARGSRGETEETVERLKAMGSSRVVVVDEGGGGGGGGGGVGEELREVKRRGVQLGLNCVGGQVGSLLFRVVGRGGTVVTYGGMSKRPLQVPTGGLIFDDVRCRGFWMSRWNEEAGEEERRRMRERVAQWMREGRLSLPVEEFPLADLAQAVKRYQEPFRERKIVLRC